MEIPVKYRLYGQKKIVQWLNQKLEMVKKELQCKISKSLKYITFKKHLTNHLLHSFSLTAKINSKLFIAFANWREKKLNRPVGAENSVRLTECWLITCPHFRKIL